MTLNSMETEQSPSSLNGMKNSTSSVDDLHDDRSESPNRNDVSPTIDATEDPDQYEERFRVDRRKLEQMLQCAGSGLGTQAEDFFLKVMESTNTQITWPSKLKIGAKSKKDPHIKVSGEPENVQQAKERVMSVLDTKSNRVTLKMDVAHTEHSHVIGKGGNNIKRVMEESGCHIHFPDSNRNNLTDKSNQVSIAGKPYGVESARLKIRDLLPVSISFEIPMNGVTQSQIEVTTPAIVRLQQQYNVTVNLKPRVRGFATTTAVIVRGTVNNNQSLKEVTQLLMENLTGSRGMLLPVSLQLEIAAQHHLFLVGRAGSNIQQITAKTGASICFPDANQMNSLNKGVVLIHGHIDNVLAAREHIMGCLPLVLMFDMKAETECDRENMTSIMQKLDVFISIKPKPKQPSKSVIVKSVEDNASNIYEARRILLGLEREEMPAKRILPTLVTASQPALINPMAPLVVPTSNFQPQGSDIQPHPTAQKPTNEKIVVRDLNQNTRISPYTSNSGQSPSNQTSTYGDSPVSGMSNSPSSLRHSNGSPSGMPGQSLSPLTSVPSGTASNIPSLAAQQASAAKHISQQQQQGQRQLGQRQQQPTVDLDMLTKTLKHDLNLNSSGAHLLDMQAAVTARLLSSGSTSELKAAQQRHQQQQQQHQQQLLNKTRSPTLSKRSFSLSMSLSSSKGSLMDMIGDDCGSSQRLAESLRATSYSSRSDLLSLGNETLKKNDRLLVTSNNDLMPPSCPPQLMMSANDRMMGLQKERLMSSNSSLKPPPGILQPPAGAINPANIDTALADYERKKVMASRAIEQEPSGEARNPTDFWSGLGFSRSMPDSVIRDRLKANNVRYDGSNMATTYENDLEEEDPWKDLVKVERELARTNLNNLSAATSDHNSLSGYDNCPSFSDSNLTIDELNSTSSPINSNLGSGKWAPTSHDKKPGECSDMAELLRNYNLEKYVELFQQQEIDHATFMTLNEQDLRELGIETFGARRKMLLAINDLKKKRPTKYFSPTPGSNNPFRTPNSSSPSVNGSSFPQPIRSDIISQSGRW